MTGRRAGQDRRSPGERSPRPAQARAGAARKNVATAGDSGPRTLPDAIRVSGLRAVEALFRHAPDAIERLYLARALAPRFGALCRHLAERRRSYAIKEDVELAKIAGTQHHGGIVALRVPRPPRAPGTAEIAAWELAQRPVLVLDGGGNPHNFGAIVRTAAFLGIEQTVLSERAEQALPSAAAYRVAEGGMEFVTLWRPPSLPVFCRQLAQRYRLVGTAPGGTPLARFVRDARPIALVLGNEETGLSPGVARACSELVAISGHGEWVESLNVAVAAGILMHTLLAPR